MNPVYQNTMEMTYPEYKRMCWALKRKKFLIVSGIVSTLMLLLGIFYLYNGDVKEGVFYLAVTFLFPLLLISLYSHSLHKNYYSQQWPKDHRVQYVFYEDHLTAKTEAGNSEVPYDKLYQVIETKTNFYLLVGANQSFAVKKADCTKELLARLQGLHKTRGAEKG
ncbi:YcxB family protein [Levyella massiliensis]|uniref:YcxB family protein n=1 Tax=Levyella massiliensis TaxID=938289 RepID=UPI00037B0605|nr:YcxB family protein [Levyella massiliensis]